MNCLTANSPVDLPIGQRQGHVPRRGEGADDGHNAAQLSTSRIDLPTDPDAFVAREVSGRYSTDSSSPRRGDDNGADTFDLDSMGPPAPVAASVTAALGGPASDCIADAGLVQATGYTARQIARVLGVSKGTAANLARAEQWPVVADGNRLLYTPPQDVRAKLEAASMPAVEVRAEQRQVTVAFGQLTSQGARLRALRREHAVLRYLELVESGRLRCDAAREVVAAYNAPENVRLIAPSADGGREDVGFHFGVGALRAWVREYERHGIDGLAEQKIGRVGKRSFVAAIPQEAIDRAAFASVRHGTLGPRGRQNFARAVRNSLMSDPDLPASARRHLHGAHASKSYVPAALRAALRVSPLARDLMQGPHRASLAAPFQPCTYEDIPPGTLITADDMTANTYCWCEGGSPHGYFVGRPQILAFFDVGSWRWQLAHVIMRPSGQYTRDDVWGAVGDVMETYGLYPEWLFEGGNLWRSKLVIGERTGLSDSERFGGLKSLGCTLHHSLRPQSKAVESAFNQLQYESDNCPGFVGRNERKGGVEAVMDFVARARKGQVHPRSALPHISAYKRHVEDSMAALNAERNDGKICRGSSPDELWACAQPQLRRMPADYAWLFRAQAATVKVRRDGRIHVTVRSGALKDDHYYDAPDHLLTRAGQSVMVYWNDHRPESDAIVMTRANPPTVICAAKYVDPIPRMTATDEQMAESRGRVKAALTVARTEVARLVPRFGAVATQRVQTAEPAPGMDRIASELRQAEARAEERSEATRAARTVDAASVLARRAQRQRPDFPVA